MLKIPTQPEAIELLHKDSPCPEGITSPHLVEGYYKIAEYCVEIHYESLHFMYSYDFSKIDPMALEV